MLRYLKMKGGNSFVLIYLSCYSSQWSMCLFIYCSWGFKCRKGDQGGEAGGILKLCMQSVVSVGMIPGPGLFNTENIQRNSQIIKNLFFGGAGLWVMSEWAGAVHHLVQSNGSHWVTRFMMVWMLPWLRALPYQLLRCHSNVFISPWEACAEGNAWIVQGNPQLLE